MPIVLSLHTELRMVCLYPAFHSGLENGHVSVYKGMARDKGMYKGMPYCVMEPEPVNKRTSVSHNLECPRTTDGWQSLPYKEPSTLAPAQTWSRRPLLPARAPVQQPWSEPRASESLLGVFWPALSKLKATSFQSL